MSEDLNKIPEQDSSHAVGTGVGASGGVIAGALAGTAVAGPVARVRHHPHLTR